MKNINSLDELTLKGSYNYKGITIEDGKIANESDWEPYSASYASYIFGRYINSKTGEIRDRKFLNVNTLSDNYGCVQLEDENGNSYYTYYNPETDKLCDRKFLNVNTLSDNYGCVKLEDENGEIYHTYYNPKTDRLCDRKFLVASDLSNGYGSVGLEDKNGKRYYTYYYTYYNPETDKLCDRKFLNAGTLSNNYGSVKLEDENGKVVYGIYLPKFDAIVYNPNIIPVFTQVLDSTSDDIKENVEIAEKFLQMSKNKCTDIDQLKELAKQTELLINVINDKITIIKEKESTNYKIERKLDELKKKEQSELNEFRNQISLEGRINF